VFIGKDFHDKDIPSQIFRRLGVHTSHVIPGTTLHREEVRDIQARKREAKMRQREQVQQDAESMAQEGE
jgi:hypothetical protein